jgi:hypothetical protein
MVVLSPISFLRLCLCPNLSPPLISLTHLCHTRCLFSSTPSQFVHLSHPYPKLCSTFTFAPQISPRTRSTTVAPSLLKLDLSISACLLEVFTRATVDNE